MDRLIRNRLSMLAVEVIESACLELGKTSNPIIHSWLMGGIHPTLELSYKRWMAC